MEPALKQRLVGAAVLVALAVIFLPMLIQGPAPQSGVANVPLDAPAAPTGEFETRDLPLVAPTAAPGASVVAPDAAPADAPAVDAVPDPDAADLADAAAQAPAPAAAPTTPPAAPAPMLDAPTAGGDYAVNFGAFSTVAAADAVVASLRASQLPGYRESARVDGKQLQRVRIGPYATRAQAESARLRALHVRDDVGARVVTLDAAAEAASAPAAPAKAPPASKPAAPAVAAAPKPAPPVATSTPATSTPASTPAASTPAAAGTGFAVQVGAFSRATDANALRDRLRNAGFSAFTESVATDKGTLTRVRVGPVLNRAEAEQLRAQLKSTSGIDGIVRPHP